MNRPRARRDAVNDRATSELALRQLGELVRQVIGELSEREAGVLRLRNGLDSARFPHTLDEIGQIYGVTRERVRQIEGRAIVKLRDLYGDSDVLRDLLNCDYSGLPEHVEERALGRPRHVRWSESRDMVIFCTHHKTQHIMRLGETQCRWCSCINGSNGNGRKRRYCSDACKQAAYRARKSVTLDRE